MCASTAVLVPPCVLHLQVDSSTSVSMPFEDARPLRQQLVFRGIVTIPPGVLTVERANALADALASTPAAFWDQAFLSTAGITTVEVVVAERPAAAPGAPGALPPPFPDPTPPPPLLDVIPPPVRCCSRRSAVGDSRTVALLAMPGFVCVSSHRNASAGSCPPSGCPAATTSAGHQPTTAERHGASAMLLL
jgi:hypothetical protein